MVKAISWEKGFIKLFSNYDQCHCSTMLTTECLNNCIYCLYCFICCNICISDKDVFYEIVRLRKQMSLARLGYVWRDRLARLGYVWPDRLARLGYVWPDRLPLACCDELLWWQPCSFQQLTDLSGCWWSEIFTYLLFTKHSEQTRQNQQCGYWHSNNECLHTCTQPFVIWDTLVTSLMFINLYALKKQQCYRNKCHFLNSY